MLKHEIVTALIENNYTASEIGAMARQAIDIVNAKAAVTFNRGDEVFFKNNKGFKTTGVIVKCNRKRAVIKTDDGNWNVPYSALSIQTAAVTPRTAKQAEADEFIASATMQGKNQRDHI